MIKSFKATSGYAAKLDNLKGRTFEFFPDKVNILFGPNGCGKTTILKCCAGYTGLDLSNKFFGGGWSGPPKTMFGDAEFPEAFAKRTPGKCAAKVAWDGMPVFYNSAILGDDLSMSEMVGNSEDSPDGLMDSMEQIQLIMSPYSEGQLRMYKLGKVAEAVKKPPKPHSKVEKNDGATRKAYASYIRSLRGQKKETPHTLLWDEPDRSMDVANQILIWMQLLPHMTVLDKTQVIVASHSHTVLLLPDIDIFNIIDVQEGYVEKIRNQIFNMVLRKFDEKEDKDKPKEENGGQKKS